MDAIKAVIIIGLVLYGIPSVIAFTRRVPNAGSVFVLNLFLGWTLVFWVIALAMAVRSYPDFPGPPQWGPYAGPPPGMPGPHSPGPFPPQWGPYAGPPPDMPGPHGPAPYPPQPSPGPPPPGHPPAGPPPAQGYPSPGPPPQAYPPGQ